MPNHGWKLLNVEGCARSSEFSCWRVPNKPPVNISINSVRVHARPVAGLTTFYTKLGPRDGCSDPIEFSVSNPASLPPVSNNAYAGSRKPFLVLHHGRSIHGGHYTALVRDARGQWRHCDDQHVSPETEEHALNPTSGHPYLLLYTRL